MPPQVNITFRSGWHATPATPGVMYMTTMYLHPQQKFKNLFWPLCTRTKIIHLACATMELEHCTLLIKLRPTIYNALVLKQENSKLAKFKN